MLIHPEIISVLSLAGEPEQGTTVVEKADSHSFTTTDKTYVSLVYGHQMLGRYQKDTNGKLLDVDDKKMGIHSIKPGAYHFNKDDIKPFLIYLLSDCRDVIASGAVTPVFEDLLKALTDKTPMKEIVATFDKLVFAKKPDDGYYVEDILAKYTKIINHPMRKHFTHIFYLRGVRKWGIFIDFEGAKYTLFC